MNNTSKLTRMPGMVAAFVSFAVFAGAQQQAPPLKVTKIKDNVYFGLKAAQGSNDGVIVGTTGVIVVGHQDHNGF